MLRTVAKAQAKANVERLRRTHCPDRPPDCAVGILAVKEKPSLRSVLDCEPPCPPKGVVLRARIEFDPPPCGGTEKQRWLVMVASVKCQHCGKRLGLFAGTWHHVWSIKNEDGSGGTGGSPMCGWRSEPPSEPTYATPADQAAA